MIDIPRLWNVRTVASFAASSPRRPRMRSSSSSRASLAKASKSSSDGRLKPLRTSQPALATITEVLPLPAAATTRLRSSSTTTALRCSSVRGRASTRSKNALERSNSLAAKASLALALSASGLFRNPRTAASIPVSGAFARVSGHWPGKWAATSRASRSRSRQRLRPMYPGGSSNCARRSWTERSASFRAANSRRHQPTRAASSAAESASASGRVSPDTAASPAA